MQPLREMKMLLLVCSRLQVAWVIYGSLSVPQSDVTRRNITSHACPHAPTPSPTYTVTFSTNSDDMNAQFEETMYCACFLLPGPCPTAPMTLVRPFNPGANR